MSPACNKYTRDSTLNRVCTMLKVFLHQELFRWIPFNMHAAFHWTIINPLRNHLFRSECIFGSDKYQQPVSCPANKLPANQIILNRHARITLLINLSSFSPKWPYISSYHSEKTISLLTIYFQFQKEAIN